jgi:group I intron endonuclease
VWRLKMCGKKELEMKKKILGVYKILNIVNGKMYIGSSIDINRRWREHKNSLKCNNHPSIYLQRSWNKNNESSFLFEIIEEVEDCNILIEREQYWMDFYNSYNKNIGYNIAPKAGNNSGLKHTDETKEKMRNSAKLTEKSRSEANSGSKNNSSKLTEKDVLSIVSMLLKGYKHTEIVKNYSIGVDIISLIKSGQRWGHLLDNNTKNKLLKLKCKKLNEQLVREIKIMLIKGEKVKIIADLYEISEGSIYDIKNNRYWKNVIISEKDLEEVG